MKYKINTTQTQTHVRLPDGVFRERGLQEEHAVLHKGVGAVVGVVLELPV